MRQGALRGDLTVLREGLSLGWSYGFGSLEELARSAERLERDIYLEGSLQRVPSGLRFQLGNPPLRIGAFRSVRIWIDGVALAPSFGKVTTDRHPQPRLLSEIDLAHPFELDLGEGSTFELHLEAPPTAGPHRVRLEWSKRRHPPIVWLEFVDRLGPLDEIR